MTRYNKTSDDSWTYRVINFQMMLVEFIVNLKSNIYKGIDDNIINLLINMTESIKKIYIVKT